MSERKGGATARAAAKGVRAYMALLAVQLLLRVMFGITVPVLEAVTDALITMTALTLSVAAAWNLYSWLEESQEKRRAERAAFREPCCPVRQDEGFTVAGIDERRKPVYVPVHSSGAAMVQRAVMRGTFSMNGYRYLGPPPVVRATEVTYEVRAGVRMITGMRITEERMLPSGERHSSVCDACGSHLAFCSVPPGIPHTHICDECVRR
jgi:ABC-type nickel/cobalt efflux system permease component RcnA